MAAPGLFRPHCAHWRTTGFDWESLVSFCSAGAPSASLRPTSRSINPICTSGKPCAGSASIRARLTEQCGFYLEVRPFYLLAVVHPAPPRTGRLLLQKRKASPVGTFLRARLSAGSTRALAVHENICRSERLSALISRHTPQRPTLETEIQTTGVSANARPLPRPGKRPASPENGGAGQATAQRLPIQ